MNTYARMVDGRVAEIIEETVKVDGRDVSLDERYPAEFIAQLMPYDSSHPPTEAEPDPGVVAVPTTVTMRQARLALLAAGKLTAVNEALGSLPSPQKEAAQIEWEYAATVERGSALIGMAGAALGLTESDLDGLFTAAAAL